MNFNKKTTKKLIKACSVRNIPKYGWSDEIEKLINAGADPNVKNKNGDPVLCVTARNGYSSTIELLLKHGAEINSKTTDGLTAIEIAASIGKARILDILLENMPSQETNRYDFTKALNLAINNGQQVTTGQLLIHLNTLEIEDKLTKYIIPVQMYNFFGIIVPTSDYDCSIRNILHDYIDNTFDWQLKLLHRVNHPRSSSTFEETIVNYVVFNQSETIIGYFLDNHYQFDCGMGTEGSPHRSGVLIVELVNESIAASAGQLVLLSRAINEKI